LSGEEEMAKILLVEDNEMNRDMLTRRLERKGYEILVAGDGAQGVAVAQAQKPDLILLDMSLPVLDGWAVARALKSSVETLDIPIIALTAHAMAGDRERSLESGCDDYETKPIEMPRLLSKIAALIAARS
jgi:two-component system cell cycle response regulator DivK